MLINLLRVTRSLKNSSMSIKWATSVAKCGPNSAPPKRLMHKLHCHCRCLVRVFIQLIQAYVNKKTTLKQKFLDFFALKARKQGHLDSSEIY